MVAREFSCRPRVVAARAGQLRLSRAGEAPTCVLSSGAGASRGLSLPPRLSVFCAIHAARASEPARRHRDRTFGITNACDVMRGGVILWPMKAAASGRLSRVLGILVGIVSCLGLFLVLGSGLPQCRTVPLLPCALGA